MAKVSLYTDVALIQIWVHLSANFQNPVEGLLNADYGWDTTQHLNAYSCFDQTSILIELVLAIVLASCWVNAVNPTAIKHQGTMSTSSCTSILNCVHTVFH